VALADTATDPPAIRGEALASGLLLKVADCGRLSLLCIEYDVNPEGQIE